MQVGDHVEIQCHRNDYGTTHRTHLKTAERFGGRIVPAIGDAKMPAEERAALEREEKSVQALSRLLLRFHL